MPLRYFLNYYPEKIDEVHVKQLAKKEYRKIELWYKHMRGEQLTEEEIKEYGLLSGVLKHGD